MWLLRAQGFLAVGAAGALVCALGSGQVACSSSSSGGNFPSSSGSGSGGGDDSGGSSGGSSGGGSGSGSGSSGGEAGVEPSIMITSPTSGSTVTPTGAKDSVDVQFTVDNFTFADPSATNNCSSMSDNCGHIHVLVDGSACTPSGSPYNNDDATGSPATAFLSTCPMVNGMHKITLELHHNDHSPIQVGGMTVQDSVMVTAGSGGGDASSD